MFDDFNGAVAWDSLDQVCGPFPPNKKALPTAPRSCSSAQYFRLNLLQRVCRGRVARTG